MICELGEGEGEGEGEWGGGDVVKQLRREPVWSKEGKMESHNWRIDGDGGRGERRGGREGGGRDAVSCEEVERLRY